MEKGKRIRIGMMDIMPIFDIPAWGDVEEKFGSLDAAIDKLKAKKGWQRATVTMATILCNRALELAGDATLTESFAARHMPYKDAYSVRTACILAITAGLKMEHKSEEAEEERVDLVLRAIEKKAEPEE